MSGPVDVLAVLRRDAAQADCARDCSDESLKMAREADAALSAVAELIEDRRLLADALSAVVRMDVKGHQLQDRLQFSDTGRAILTKIDSARDAMAAALANVGGVT